MGRGNMRGGGRGRGAPNNRRPNSGGRGGGRGGPGGFRGGRQFNYNNNGMGGYDGPPPMGGYGGGYDDGYDDYYNYGPPMMPHMPPQRIPRPPVPPVPPMSLMRGMGPNRRPPPMYGGYGPPGPPLPPPRSRFGPFMGGPGRGRGAKMGGRILKSKNANGVRRGGIQGKKKMNEKVMNIEIKKPWVVPELEAEIKKKYELLQKSKQNPSDKEAEKAYKEQAELVAKTNSELRSKYTKDHEQYQCDPCSRAFDSYELLQAHLEEHTTCGIDGCQLSAHQSIIDLHVRFQHKTGLYKKINTQEIDLWIEERKKRFPSLKNVEDKIKTQAEKQDRGELLEKSNNLFSNRKEESVKPRVLRPNKRGGRNKKKRKISSVIDEIKDMLDDDSYCHIKLRKFCGLGNCADGESSNTNSTPSINNTEISFNLRGKCTSHVNKEKDALSDDRLVLESKTLCIKNETVPLSNDMNFVVISSLDTNNKPIENDKSADVRRTKSEDIIKKEEVFENPISFVTSHYDDIDDDQDDAPEEIKNCINIDDLNGSVPNSNSDSNPNIPENHDSKKNMLKNEHSESEPCTFSNPSKPKTNSSIHTCKIKNSKKLISDDPFDSYCHNKTTLRQHRGTNLLEKLLEDDIIHERNVILQCVHYIVKNNFFKDENSSGVKNVRK